MVKRLEATTSRFALKVITYALLCIGGGALSLGCGLSWTIPEDHFPGVNGRGFVSYFEKVGEVDFGDGLALPLIINFNSGNELVSPYFGKSFTLFLLESNIVQTAENTFLATFPDGSLNLFIRNRPEETILYGSDGWKGEIKGDMINVYAPCGWKLAFSRGRILSIVTDKDRKFDYVYSGNAVTAIRENGKDKLTVEADQGTGEVKALLFNNMRMEVVLDQKPKVQVIAGQRVVAGIDRALKYLNPTDGSSKAFEFAVNGQMQPTLKVVSKTNTDRIFVWDAATRLIVSDGDWVYNITTPNGVLATAAIKRENGQKQSEYWFDDEAKGLEITQGINGIKQIKTWFVSGVAAGALRKIEVIRPTGLTDVTYRASYDEGGGLLDGEHPFYSLIYKDNKLVNVVDRKHQFPLVITTNTKENPSK